MKKSELKKIIREEYKKVISEDNSFGKWMSPLSVTWKYDGPGLWRVIVKTHDNNKVVVDGLLSDSMPNTVAKFNQLCDKFIETTKKLTKD